MATSKTPLKTQNDGFDITEERYIGRVLLGVDDPEGTAIEVAFKMIARAVQDQCDGVSSTYRFTLNGAAHKIVVDTEFE